MDTEHRVIAELLALTEAPDDVLLDQVEAIGERAARYMLFDEAAQLLSSLHSDSSPSIIHTFRPSGIWTWRYSNSEPLDDTTLSRLRGPLTTVFSITLGQFLSFDRIDMASL